VELVNVGVAEEQQGRGIGGLLVMDQSMLQRQKVTNKLALVIQVLVN